MFRIILARVIMSRFFLLQTTVLVLGTFLLASIGSLHPPWWRDRMTFSCNFTCIFFYVLTFFIIFYISVIVYNCLYLLYVYIFYNWLSFYNSLYVLRVYVPICSILFYMIYNFIYLYNFICFHIVYQFFLYILCLCIFDNCLYLIEFPVCSINWKKLRQIYII